MILAENDGTYTKEGKLQAREGPLNYKSEPVA
jgi:hypothetical protein